MCTIVVHIKIVKLSVKLLMGFLGVGNPCLALFLQSEVAIPGKIEAARFSFF